MSEVYRAYDTVMGRDVALKRLLPIEETNLNDSAGESLAREAAVLARFSHANVVTVFAFEEDAEGPFVVMELVEGEDLHATLKSGPLSWEDFRDVAGQCLEPLVAAAELNLLHRDIKPGNLMLKVTPSGRLLVKLLDFGLAKFSQHPSLQTLDQRGSFLGSIDFIAPEQLELRPLDQRTDLYSLGCVFYYMLVRESPFTGANPAETAMNHIKHHCTPIAARRSDLPPLVADWLMRLISRNPDDRPKDARDALRQFQEALKGVPYCPWANRSEEDDLPIGRWVGPPPAAPVGPPPPSGPVGPPTGAFPAVRAIQTASGPVSATRSTTAPVTGSSLPAPRRNRRPFLPANETGPFQAPDTNQMRPAADARSSVDGRRKGPAAAKETRQGRRAFRGSLTPVGKAILAGVAAALFLTSWLLLRKGDADEETLSAAVGMSPSGRDQSSSAGFATLPYPTTLSVGDGVPALPANDSISPRFRGSQGAVGRDYETPAAGRYFAPFP